MWKQVPSSEPVLLLRIQSKEQRVFTFAIDQIGGEELTPVGQAERDFAIDSNSQEQLNSLLRSLVERPEGAIHAESFSRLGQLLFQLVLPDWVQRTLAAHHGPVVIQASDVGLPWELLHDGDGFLCLRNPFSRRLAERDFAVRPSAEFPPEAEGFRALIVADPEDDLPPAREEAEELAAVFQQCGGETTTLIGSKDARWEIVLDRLRATKPEHCYNIVHLSGHVRERRTGDGRVVRALTLSRGGAISPDEIIRVFRCPQAFVFINACFGQPVEDGSPGRGFNAQLGQTRSLVSAFLSWGGCKGVVSTMWWVIDHVAQGASSRFYRDVLNGTSVGDALLRARQQISQQDDPALWASYIHYGDPRLCLRRLPAEPVEAEVRPAVEPDKPSPAVEAAEPQSPVTEMDEKQSVRPAAAPTEMPGQAPAAPAAPAAPVAPAAPEQDETPRGLPPLDVSARLAIVNAFHEQQEMQWPELSTVHLIVGMMQVPDSATWRLLEPTGLPLNVLVELLRKSLKDDQGRLKASPRAKGAPGVRSSVLRLVTRAHEIAKKAGRDAVGEPDLLDAVLASPKAGAYLILDVLLKAAGKSLDVLARQRREMAPVTQTSSSLFTGGSVDRSRLTENLLIALDLAVEEARKLGWPEVRTPHLALGMMARPKSEIGTYAAESGLDILRLVESLRTAMRREEEAGSAPRLHREFLSDNVLKYFERAAKLAQRRGSAQIDEKDLWRVMLEDQSGIVVRWLMAVEVSPVRLLPQGW